MSGATSTSEHSHQSHLERFRVRSGQRSNDYKAGGDFGDVDNSFTRYGAGSASDVAIPDELLTPGDSVNTVMSCSVELHKSPQPSHNLLVRGSNPCGGTNTLEVSGIGSAASPLRVRLSSLPKQMKIELAVS